jgi:tetratricopeptide (TPR) repeat protein
MYNVLIAVAVAIVSTVLITLFGFSWYAGLLPGILLGFGAYILLARRIGTLVAAISEKAQAAVTGVQPKTEKERDGLIDKSIAILEEGFAYEKWQYFLAPELHGNVGVLKYMKKDYVGAQPHLEQSYARNWMAKAMLGCVHYFEKRDEPMKAAFEECVKNGGKKESLAWALYVWCLFNRDKKDESLSVLGRGIAENPNDEKLKKLQAQIANGKRLKMNGYEPGWWQFGLEKPPNEMMNQQRVKFMRSRRR